MTDEKKPNVIGFKPDEKLLEVFLALVEDLKVTKSELAELALKKGLRAAVEEIRSERMALARETIAKEKEVEKRLKRKVTEIPFNLGRSPVVLVTAC